MKRFAVALTFVAFAHALSAQTIITVPPVPGAIRSAGVALSEAAVPLPPNLPPELAARLAASRAAMEAEAQAGTPSADPDEARVQALLQIQIDRRPEALLQNGAKLLGNEPAPTNEVERFQFHILTGNWAAVGEFLRSLSTNAGPRVYDHLVQQLLATPNAPRVRPPMVSAISAMPMNPMQGMPQPTHLLLPEDVFGLANACPGDLTDERLNALGQLLARAAGEGGRATAPIVARLEEGIGVLGGADPMARYRAARLLIAAGRLQDAERLLPPLDPAASPRDFGLMELHASLLAAKGSARDAAGSEPDGANRKATVLRAWELTELALHDPDCPPRERESAIGRMLELLPLLEPGQGSNWLRSTFVTRPDLGAALIAHVGGAVARGNTERQAEPRSKNLKQQKATVATLLGAGVEMERWRLLLQVMAAGWSAEAESTRERPPMNQAMGQAFDPFGNPIFMGNAGRVQNPNQPQPITAEELLQSAPDGAWLAALDPAGALRVRTLHTQLQFRAGAFEAALTNLRSMAAEDPVLGRALAHELLNAWAEARQPSRPMAMQQRIYYPGMYQQPGGIPLTRAHQERNLEQLSRLLANLRTLPIEPLDDSTLVATFTRAHSNAEVFRIEDIQRVFGSLDTLRPTTLAELLQTMRSRLAAQWRQPRVQQEAKTRRTDKEIAAEVGRGYEVVIRLAAEALQRKPDDWNLLLSKAATLYDWAEFDYGQKVDLAVYTGRRDEAFGIFAEAARRYTELVPQLEESQQTPRVFQLWFNATLGAADLSYLTRQTEPSTNQLARIRAAMLALPEDSVDRHLAAFGRELSEAAGGLQPELKPRYARAGLEIVKDHPSAREARELVAYYADLLQEIRLDVRVDGDAVVGHDLPFGVFVSILHTDAVGRESGGFNKYLQNQGSRGFYYNPMGGGPSNYRDDFEKQVTEKYLDGFEIMTVAFHDEKVEARGTDRPGWREFPYAYLLLKAKDAAIDKLPSLELSMDFADPKGQVILPVASTPVLIDARPTEVPPRPARQVEILQVLDDRELAEGHVTLEIKATARGLVPDLEALLDVNIPGFRVTSIDDRGLSVASMDVENAVAPVSERLWLLNLEPQGAGGEGVTFAFPTARNGNAQLTYKRYADADLVEVPASVAMAGVPLRPNYAWAWIVGAVALASLVVVALLRRRSPREPERITPTYALPPEITPFSVIHLLERLHRDETTPLSADQRAELAATMRDLQHRYFNRSNNGHPSGDLQGVAERWIAAARN